MVSQIISDSIAALIVAAATGLFRVARKNPAAYWRLYVVLWVILVLAFFSFSFWNIGASQGCEAVLAPSTEALAKYHACIQNLEVPHVTLVYLLVSSYLALLGLLPYIIKVIDPVPQKGRRKIQSRS
jgi:hypothetical protein